jgi:Pentapeptide repeats (8 copies)
VTNTGATNTGSTNTGTTNTGTTNTGVTNTGVVITPYASGSYVTSLSISAGMTGIFPYSATVLPLRGQLASGMTLQSGDDRTLETSILSRWDDGSAAVVVVSGRIATQSGQS